MFLQVYVILLTGEGAWSRDGGLLPEVCAWSRGVSAPGGSALGGAWSRGASTPEGTWSRGSAPRWGAWSGGGVSAPREGVCLVWEVPGPR